MEHKASQNGFLPAAGLILSRQGACMLIGALACFLLLPLYAGWVPAAADAARVLIGLGVTGGFLMYAGEALTSRRRSRTVHAGAGLPRKRLIRS